MPVPVAMYGNAKDVSYYLGTPRHDDDGRSTHAAMRDAS